jgi:FkbM family methyltransferase
VRKLVKNVAQRFGYDILHLPTDPIVRQWLDLINAFQINLIFDVGANTGQFGRRARTLGYSGELVSFEPIADTHQQLQTNVASDPNWKTVHCAIGHYDGSTEINVSTNSYSSSILDMLPVHIESAPDAVYTRQETIRVQKIDSIIDQYYRPGKNLYVKIDTQGFERQVFEGSRQSFNKIKGFQMELSLQPMYEGETLMEEMINLLREEGYKLKLIDSGHRNYETGELLQVEGYFFR